MVARKRTAATEGQPPDIGIGKLLRRAHIAFSRAFRNRLAERGITFSEFIHLERLWDEDGLNQIEISRRVGITAASSTQTIATLDKRGFIVRRRNPEDRRHIKVFLTPAGKRLRNRLLDCARATNRAARTGLSVNDTLVLFRLVETIIANLDAEPRPDKIPSDRARTEREGGRSPAG